MLCYPLGCKQGSVKTPAKERARKPMYQLLVTKYPHEVRVMVNRNNRRLTCVKEKSLKLAVKQAVKLVRMARKGGF